MKLSTLIWPTSPPTGPVGAQLVPPTDLTAGDLEAAALAALRAAGAPFERLEPGVGFRRPRRRDHAHWWIICNAGTGRAGQPWLQVSAGDPKAVGGVDTATFTWSSWKDLPWARLDPIELGEVQAAIAEQKRQAEIKRAQEQAKARERAAADWTSATPAPADHPYLVRKGVAAHGVRVAMDGCLLVPVQDADGTLHAVQRIAADGTKRFTTGGAITGHYALLQPPDATGRLCLCEGYATAATVLAASAPGTGVALACHCGNLGPVATALRQHYPQAHLTIVGDDDAWTPGNPGRTHASAAARAVGAHVIFPRFADTTAHPTDFNDLAAAEGLAVVQAQLTGPSTPQEPERLRAVDLRDLATATLEPPRFVIRPLIPRGYLTLFGGHGGSGKSTVALILAAHVAAGRNWGGLDVRRGTVLFVSYEDPDHLVLYRLRQIAETYGLSIPDIQANLTLIDATKAAPIMVETSLSGIRTVIPSTDGQDLVALVRELAPDLTIIDNASDAFEGDENARRQVRTFVRYLALAVELHAGAILLLAHIDKAAAKFGANKNSYSGSTGWHNSARSRLALTNDTLHQEKLNVGKALETPIVLAWSEHGVPMPTTGELAPSLVAQQHADDAAVLACFAAAAEFKENVPVAERGGFTTWHVFSTYAECPESLRTDQQRFREAITRLRRERLIEVEMYRNLDHKPRQRFVLATTSRAFMSRAEEQARIDPPVNPPVTASGGLPAEISPYTHTTYGSAGTIGGVGGGGGFFLASDLTGGTTKTGWDSEVDL